MVRPWPMVAPTMAKPMRDVDNVFYMVRLIGDIVTLFFLIIFIVVLLPPALLFLAIHLIRSIIVLILLLLVGTVPNVNHSRGARMTTTTRSMVWMTRDRRPNWDDLFSVIIMIMIIAMIITARRWRMVTDG